MSKEIKPYRLLLIEDNPADYFLLEQFLKKSKLSIEKIHHVENMMSVAALVKENDFDIVLLDLTLPDSTGVDSVISLYKLLPQTPIVVLSGVAMIEMAVESIAFGAQDYLLKGEFDEKLLAKTVQYSIERKKTTEKLRESNERYELASKATMDVIWDWNISTNTIYMNNSIFEIFGYTEKEFDLNWFLEKVHPLDAERMYESLRLHFEKTNDEWQGQFRLRSADGTYKEVLQRGYALFDEENKPYRMIGAITDLTETKKLEDKLVALELQQQKQIMEVTIQAQEKEKNLLGRELHDNITQILATVKMYLKIAKSGDYCEEDLLGKSYDYVNDAIEELRKLSHSLVAPSLGDISLEEVLQILVEDASVYKDLKVELVIDKNFKEEDKNKELMLYRIVQEQLNNIIKYAEAKTVVITIKTANGKLFLTVADDGVGFDTTQKITGIGLRNISSRVEFYFGNMNIISAPGKGCTLEIYIPC